MGMKAAYLLKKSRGGRKGATLIEAILAMIILAILAIGGMSFIVHGTNQLNIYRNKLIALEIANNRLEELRALNYEKVATSPQNDTSWYVKKKSDGTWELDIDGNLMRFSETDAEEPVVINGLTKAITTTIQYMDKSGSPGGSCDYLLVIAKTGYRAGSSEIVELRTYIGPYK